MTTESNRILVSGMPVDVVRKDIKNVHLAVYPPRGRVRIAAPRRLSDDAIRLAVVTRIGWIRRQQRSFEGQARQSDREFVSGESHYVSGRRYRLRVVEGDSPARVRIRTGRILELIVRPGTDRDGRARVVDRWHRERLRAQATEYMAKWQAKIGVKVAAWGIRKMRTRWGTCQIESRRIWINLDLAKKPRACLEYIIVHELSHLLERHHNDRFRGLMGRFLPGWRSVRDELNRAPLAHEEWDY